MILDNIDTAEETIISNIEDVQFEEADKVLNQMEDYMKSILDLFISHKMTFANLERTCSIINSKPTTNIKIPETKYNIMKHLFPEIRNEFYIFCDNCKIYNKNSDKKVSKIQCSNCESELRANQHNFFVYMGLEKQLRRIVQKYWKDIVKFQKEIQNSLQSEEISDICNGKILKTILINNFTTLSLTLNTDGVQVFESRKKSLWPIQLSCNFLPPHLRFQLQNIIVVALHFGFKKPNVTSYFQPLLEELSRFENSHLTIDIEGQCHKFNVWLIRSTCHCNGTML